MWHYSTSPCSFFFINKTKMKKNVFLLKIFFPKLKLYIISDKNVSDTIGLDMWWEPSPSLELPSGFYIHTGSGTHRRAATQADEPYCKEHSNVP